MEGRPPSKDPHHYDVPHSTGLVCCTTQVPAFAFSMQRNTIASCGELVLSELQTVNMWNMPAAPDEETMCTDGALWR
jgi:hypothetical protein